MIRWPKGLDGLCYGGDYNPEQWPEEVWTADVDLMRRAGVNLVTVGAFAWARLEPSEGGYTFDWLDRVFDLLHSGGIKVNLATPTASPPPWFSLAYPDALPVTADGVRLSHGSRDTYCLAAPAYRAACTRIAEALARRYAGHPALAMWHVGNEYGTGCTCDHVAGAFREWLRRRYSDLDRLNAAWATAFWSQHYSDWEQVVPPRATRYLPNPSQALDFRRFTSDELLTRFREQRDALRALTPDVPVTTNFVFGGWVDVDHRRWAEEADLVAIDHYPASPGIQAEEETAFVADLARSWARGRPWLLMESSPGGIHDGRILHAKAPGRVASLSLAHVARGSRGVMFFQWRASRGGAEQFHPAMVPHAGPGSRVYREVSALGATLPRLAEADAGEVEAPVAILWDAEAWWAGEIAGLPSTEVHYLDALRVAHRALWRRGTTAAFVHPEADLSRYRLVLVPSLYLISDAGAKSLRRYVRGGGRLIVSFLSGIVDSDAQVRLGGYPGALREVLGVRVEEFHPLPPEATVPLSDGRTGRLWSEHVHLEGAVAEAAYTGGVLDGCPAVTRNRSGSGIAWYLSTRLSDEEYGRFVAAVAAESGIEPPVLAPEPGVEYVRRRAGQTRWLFVLNHTEYPYEVAADGVELITGREVAGVVEVPAGGVAVVRSVQASR